MSLFASPERCFCRHGIIEVSQLILVRRYFLPYFSNFSALWWVIVNVGLNVTVLAIIGLKRQFHMVMDWYANVATCRFVNTWRHYTFANFHQWLSVWKVYLARKYELKYQIRTKTKPWAKYMTAFDCEWTNAMLGSIFVKCTIAS